MRQQAVPLGSRIAFLGWRADVTTIYAAADLIMLSSDNEGMPVSLIEASFVVLSCAVFGCSLALALSVWGRKTHEVVMATYVVGILYLLAPPIYAGLHATLPLEWRASWLPWMPARRPWHISGTAGFAGIGCMVY